MEAQGDGSDTKNADAPMAVPMKSTNTLDWRFLKMSYDFYPTDEGEHHFHACLDRVRMAFEPPIVWETPVVDPTNRKQRRHVANAKKKKQH